ncbi:MAG: polynucleotide adenylyltransferase PcnB [Planctomycetota bacterium]|nr:polynucleotide adenylyltransferase PcnB [Planctomycetota bacterium]
MSSAPRVIDLPFSAKRLDRRAVSVVSQLRQAGHETYLVGGCVRDLLLGLSPKDFDIATSATPQQVRRVFGRRSRIIGKRFPIVHVRSGQEIYEIATFRSAPKKSKETKTLARDTNYGTVESDALRRDFTINALYLDPESLKIYDWTDGLGDLEKRLMRSIGDPNVRFKEDPVRILRLIKFMRRLDFDPGPAEIDAARSLASVVKEAAAARIADEVLRLMRTKCMTGVFADLFELKLLPTMLPEVSHWLKQDENNYQLLSRQLAALDSMPWRNSPSGALLLACLYGPMVEQEVMATSNYEFHTPQRVAVSWLRGFQERAHMPRHVLSDAKHILALQHRLDTDIAPKKHGISSKAIGPLRRQPYLKDALRYCEIRLLAAGRDTQLCQDWRNKLLPKAPSRR